MKRCLLSAGLALILPLSLCAQQANVEIQPPNLHGSRALEELTRAAVIRDYLQSWTSFRQAFEQNQPKLLEQDFVGVALTKLRSTIAEQQKLGIHTRYEDHSHRLQIVFYSPDGLSIQLIDEAVYDEEVFEGTKLLASHPVQARYVVVLSPSQVRWQVRVFQAEAE